MSAIRRFLFLANKIARYLYKKLLTKKASFISQLKTGNNEAFKKLAEEGQFIVVGEISSDELTFREGKKDCSTKRARILEIISIPIQIVCNSSTSRIITIMKMKTICAQFVYDDNTCVKAYDPETKTLVGTYRNYQDASNKLGIYHSAVKNACARRGRSFSRTFNKELALRLTTIKQEVSNV